MLLKSKISRLRSLRRKTRISCCSRISIPILFKYRIYHYRIMFIRNNSKNSINIGKRNSLDRNIHSSKTNNLLRLTLSYKIKNKLSRDNGKLRYSVNRKTNNKVIDNKKFRVKCSRKKMLLLIAL